MNYASFIVKIVEKPKQRFSNNQISVTEVLIKFSQIKNQANSLGSVFYISIWDNLTYDFVRYYEINDYILIEGYISIRENLFNDLIYRSNKHVEISVFRIHPFILKSV